MFGNIVAGVLGIWVLGGAGPGPSYNFLVLSGGGRPENNEIALEKNALYFQRTLRVFEVEPADISLYFANGNDGQETVRYLDRKGKERFKAPEIPHLLGPSTRASFQEWLERTLQERSQRPIFLYFTGHGGLNDANPDNNYLMLWDKRTLSVRALSRALDRLSPETPVVAVMSQCFAGSFANFIYQGGDPTEPVAAQARCGFFATVKENPSVGCTPEVDEEDYRDYSTSFFAGLSGYDRVGQPVVSADYDEDGQVSFAEAHAYAKVDEDTTDWPVSTSELWLQRKARSADEKEIADRPILEFLPIARPEQRQVIQAIARRLELDVAQSFVQNEQQLRKAIREEQAAYGMRFWMELLNVGMEVRLRAEGDPARLEVLDRLIACENSSWHAPPAVKAFPQEGDGPEVPSLCVTKEEGGTPHPIATGSDLRRAKKKKAWTPRFAALFARAGMSLKDPLNLLYMQDHASPHPEVYHQEIYDLLQATLEGCGDRETCGEVLRMALRRLASELCTPDTPLSSLVTW
jgi:hypothetical protein